MHLNSMNWLRLLGAFEKMIATSFAGPLGCNVLPAVAFPVCNDDADARSMFSWNVLWGTPVHKTCRPRKKTRMFGQHRLLKRNKNLVPCPKCGTLHELHTICGACYAHVREQSLEILEKLHAFNGRLGDPKDPPSSEPDDFIKPTTITEKRPCRTDWYSKHLKETWHRVFDTK